jgi:hypothetical protein
MQSHFATYGEGVTLEDVLAPLDPVPFNICKQLLNQHALIIKLLLCFFLNRQVELNLSKHLIDCII